MDLSFVTDYYMPLVLVACLIVGYCIKHISALSKSLKEYIPTILAVLGGILACVSEQNITFSLVVSGAFTGLASTGLHQAFKQLICKNDKPSDREGMKL